MMHELITGGDKPLGPSNVLKTFQLCEDTVGTELQYMHSNICRQPSAAQAITKSLNYEALLCN